MITVTTTRPTSVAEKVVARTQLRAALVDQLIELVNNGAHTRAQVDAALIAFDAGVASAASDDRHEHLTGQDVALAVVEHLFLELTGQVLYLDPAAYFA